MLRDRGRFPDLLEEIPAAAMEYAAGLVRVPAADFANYPQTGRTTGCHHAQVREALGFLAATLEDEEQLTAWLAAEVCPVELVKGRQRDAPLAERRTRNIEPPGRTWIEKVLVAGRGPAGEGVLHPNHRAPGRYRHGRLLALVAEDNEDGMALLAALKRDPGPGRPGLPAGGDHQAERRT
ncbi:DUF4158 domain-containing protein [Streptomyces sp. NPDC000410]|uniref:DUF4158 domain-containing protein n=1 Tax=Streptomyces sp. NPDC000410 TaxID=3154254 RepID=UPI0033312BC1